MSFCESSTEASKFCKFVMNVEPGSLPFYRKGQPMVGLLGLCIKNLGNNLLSLWVLVGAMNLCYPDSWRTGSFASFEVDDHVFVKEQFMTRANCSENKVKPKFELNNLRRILGESPRDIL